jgi:hypothetical protein
MKPHRSMTSNIAGTFVILAICDYVIDSVAYSSGRLFEYPTLAMRFSILFKP